MSKKKRKDTEVTSTESDSDQSAVKEAHVETEQPADEVSEDTGEATETEPQEEPCEEDRLKARVEELEDKLLRLAAEFDNYKKRMARQYDDIIRTANDRILIELLDVMDNFERALQHDNENSNFESFRKGTELIFDQMTALLNKHDVRPIEALGKPFDPNLHEALMPVESEEYPEGTVAVEMSKGYMQGGRVLRHSKVGVSRGKTDGKKQQKQE